MASMVVIWWIVGFLPSDTNDEDVWMTTEWVYN